MAKSKRKTTRKKTRRSGKASTRSTRKKTSSKAKKTARKPASKKKTGRKKTATRTKKKAAARKKSAAKKKKKKKTTKKKTARKTAAKKKTKTKTKKKAPARTKSKKKTTSKKKASSGTTKKSAASGSSKSSKVISKKRGRSVAEVASSAKTDEQGYVFINGRRVRMISTQGKVVQKKKTAAKAPVPEEKEQLKKPLKTHLSRKELNHYKNLLMIKRAELVGDLTAMEAEALRSNVGNISHMPIHMADIGSDAYEQDFMLGLAEAERKQIREIDDALQRIEEKTYGVCLHTGNPIPKARLDAKPWARYTIEAARIMESQQP